MPGRCHVLFLFLIVFPASVEVTWTSKSGEETMPALHWESLKFALPSNHDPVSESCLNLKKNYCLLNYQFEVSQGYHEAMPSDEWAFQVIVRPQFQDINWISHSRSDKGGCCNYQSDQYKEYGQRMGLTPLEYMEKMTDYTTDNKHVNLIKAKFIPSLCVNIITEIGFGPGNLKVFGRITGHTFLLPILSLGEFVTIRKDDLQYHTKLTFGWFKENVMCFDNPWICGRKPPVQQVEDQLGALDIGLRRRRDVPDEPVPKSLLS